jgi:hypothetical protein
MPAAGKYFRKPYDNADEAPKGMRAVERAANDGCEKCALYVPDTVRWARRREPARRACARARCLSAERADGRTVYFVRINAQGDNHAD